MGALLSTREASLLSPRDVLDSSFLERQKDAERINRFANDPSVRPHVGGSGAIDLSEIAACEQNVILCGEHGGVVFHCLMPGLYEMHTVVLPEGRGPWMVHGSRHAFHHMFTQTDCLEIVTKCPRGNVPASAGARAVGMASSWFVTQHMPNGDLAAAFDVWSLSVQKWSFMDGVLSSVGEWFHERIRREYVRHGAFLREHTLDAVHDTVTGAAVAMIHGGQVMKGLSIYNRWALMSNHAPCVIASIDPLMLDMSECIVRVTGDDFEVMSCRSD